MKKFVSFLILTVVFLQIVNVFLSNTIASGSVEAATIQSEIEKVEEKNVILKTELLQHSSLTRIASRAAELGFKDTKTFVTVNTPLPVAVSSHTSTE